MYLTTNSLLPVPNSFTGISLNLHPAELIYLYLFAAAHTELTLDKTTQQLQEQKVGCGLSASGDLSV